MGFADRPEMFEDHFNAGDEFVLEGLKLGPKVETEFGEKTTVVMTIDGKLYSALGAGFLRQAQQVEPGDFPAKVRFEVEPARGPNRSGMKVLNPA